MLQRKTIALIPARGGSRGVPRKNLRVIDGQPMIGYSIRAAIDSGLFESVVVSTDDAEVARVAENLGATSLERPRHLAQPTSTIADVVAHVVDVLDWSGSVCVLQPTSPLRKGETLALALKRFSSEQPDSLATVVREPHLYWLDPDGDLSTAHPLFAERANRQFAHHQVLRETGSIQIVSAQVARSGKMVGARHLLLEVPEDEGLDVDTHADLAQARQRLESGLVVFRLTANSRVGSGHLYHCLQLAEEMSDLSVRFLLKDCDDFVGQLLNSKGWEWQLETRDQAELATLATTSPRRVLVNDVLDTSEAEILRQRAHGFKVVCIEDLGVGSRYADVVINALYGQETAGASNVLIGSRWATLRSEFHGLACRDVRKVPTRVLVTFGGTDPAGLATRFGAALAVLLSEGVSVRVILGLGAAEVDLPPGVDVVRSVPAMSAAMLDSDVVVTSAGRTVYEAAATGTPIVVVAQNAREATHAHLGYDSGVIFLGLGPLVDEDHLVSVVRRLLADASLRQELSRRLQASLDGRGAERIGHRVRTLLLGFDD